jgi:hypothetical protein
VYLALEAVMSCGLVGDTNILEEYTASIFRAEVASSCTFTWHCNPEQQHQHNKVIYGTFLISVACIVMSGKL